MKYLTLLILLFSFTAVTAQEITNDSTNMPCVIVQPIENDVIINTNTETNTVVFNKKKATFYLNDFGLDKISRAKHTEFFYKKPTKKVC